MAMPMGLRCQRDKVSEKLPLMGGEEVSETVCGKPLFVA